jgi:hypothetical protein
VEGKEGLNCDSTGERTQQAGRATGSKSGVRHVVLAPTYVPHLPHVALRKDKERRAGSTDTGGLNFVKRAVSSRAGGIRLRIRVPNRRGGDGKKTQSTRRDVLSNNWQHLWRPLSQDLGYASGQPCWNFFKKGFMLAERHSRLGSPQSGTCENNEARVDR